MPRLRFVIQTVPLLVFLLALFAFLWSHFGRGPVSAAAVLDPARAPLLPLVGAWLLEAFGLLALYLLIAERSGGHWLDGVLAGWVAWIFRGPLLVITVVAAAGQPQAPWGRLAFGWWVLYTVCGLAMTLLDQRRRAAPGSVAAADGRSLEDEAGPPGNGDRETEAAGERETDPPRASERPARAFTNGDS